MPRNVFLSFDSDDLEYVNLFRGQAKNKTNDLEFSDHSVKEPFDSKNAEYIRRQIREKMERASVTLCLIGRNTHASRWVDWELRTSSELEKGLVGMYLYDPNGTVPQALKVAKAEVVPWDHERVVAIDRAAKKR